MAKMYMLDNFKLSVEHFLVSFLVVWWDSRSIEHVFFRCFSLISLIEWLIAIENHTIPDSIEQAFEFFHLIFLNYFSISKTILSNARPRDSTRRWKHASHNWISTVEVGRLRKRIDHIVRYKWMCVYTTARCRAGYKRAFGQEFDSHRRHIHNDDEPACCDHTQPKRHNRALRVEKVCDNRRRKPTKAQGHIAYTSRRREFQKQNIRGEHGLRGTLDTQLQEQDQICPKQQLFVRRRDILHTADRRWHMAQFEHRCQYYIQAGLCTSLQSGRILRSGWTWIEITIAHKRRGLWSQSTIVYWIAEYWQCIYRFNAYLRGEFTNIKMASIFDLLIVSNYGEANF